MTRQNVASTVTGDKRADSPLETDVDVRVTSPPCFLEREAGAGALASRAQETPGKNMDLVHVCHTHERLVSDSEVIVLEQVSIGIYDPGMALLNHGRTEKPFPEQEAGASRAQETPARPTAKAER